MRVEQACGKQRARDHGWPPIFNDDTLAPNLPRTVRRLVWVRIKNFVALAGQSRMGHED
jgi:hypothetical protein